ncbi:Aste57867_13137 [Aphanomyces stellatus]|uniref:Aste57867_13137 protein n=1 Tax=Aphanomyces stellatus TaxID=120398 RepID=A0A485KXC2_9STRA|nr:hypothetical protein As57867_013088 [Aphanomyces stellatus]VFT89979.1 Aste57867_13137 [Aphanomyces stellatus]
MSEVIAAPPPPPTASPSRHPVWIFAAIMALMGLGFLALNFESDFVIKTSAQHHRDTLQHAQLLAANLTAAPIVVEKIVEVVKTEIVEKIVIKEAPSAVDRTTAFTAHNYDETTVHLVYSTSCDQPNRHFLSAGLQVSASRIGHRGPITEIISGCDESGVDRVGHEPSFYYDYHQHFSPSYSQHRGPNKTDYYTPYNKPFSLQHFLENAVAPVGVSGNMPLALVDADFFFFQPLRVNTGKNISQYYHGSARQGQLVLDTVVDGQALAQDWTPYYGSGWFDPGSKDKKDAICAGKPCADVSNEDGLEYYAGTGPPYILTKHDWVVMVDDYANFVVEGRKLSDNWMVEMYAYGLAAGNHGIKHTIVSNLGATWPKVEERTWNFLPESDAEMANPCDNTSLDVVMPADPPVAIHYCQKYGFLDEDDQGWHFYKYHIPYDILKCDAMLLQLPPPTQWTDIPALNLTGWKLRSKRHEVWAECSLGKIMNQVFLTVKEKLCPMGFNTHQGIPMSEPHKRDSALPGGVPKIKTP